MPLPTQGYGRPVVQIWAAVIPWFADHLPTPDVYRSRMLESKPSPKSLTAKLPEAPGPAAPVQQLEQPKPQMRVGDDAHSRCSHEERLQTLREQMMPRQNCKCGVKPLAKQGNQSSGYTLHRNYGMCVYVYR